jgi:hypothetical protein
MTAGILQENYLLLTSPHKLYVPSFFYFKGVFLPLRKL